jgi:hypothetical protein
VNPDLAETPSVVALPKASLDRVGLCLRTYVAQRRTQLENPVREASCDVSGSR